MIDWAVFDKYPENIVECRCGEVYRSHTKISAGEDGVLRIYSRKPCPSCGVSIGNPCRVSSDPETFMIGKTERTVDSGLSAEQRHRSGCPCAHTTPCDPRCSCVMPYSSSGCLRCCSYGGREQQRAMAEHLASIIDAAHSKTFGDERGGSVSSAPCPECSPLVLGKDQRR